MKIVWERKITAPNQPSKSGKNYGMPSSGRLNLGSVPHRRSRTTFSLARGAGKHRSHQPTKDPNRLRPATKRMKMKKTQVSEELTTRLPIPQMHSSDHAYFWLGFILCKACLGIQSSFALDISNNHALLRFCQFQYSCPSLTFRMNSHTMVKNNFRGS